MIHEEDFQIIYHEEVKETPEITKFVDGEVVNEYQIQETIGQGRNGKVYKVEKTPNSSSETKEIFAMKVIKKN